MHRTPALVPPVFRDKARRAAGSGSTRKRRNAGPGNMRHQPRRGSAAFARARRCGSLVQNDCTAVTAPCSHAKATRARACDAISVSPGARPRTPWMKRRRQSGKGAGGRGRTRRPRPARPPAAASGFLQAGLRTREGDAGYPGRIAFPRASRGCAAVALDPPVSAYRCGGSAGIANVHSRTGFPIIPGVTTPGHLKASGL